MSLKYIYVIGDKRLPGYGHLYQFGHAPLDGYLIRYLHDVHGAPQLSVAWSQLDYEEYLRFQQWIRDNSENSAPLAVEFYLWPEAKRSES